MPYLQNSQEFLELFGDLTAAGYHHPTFLTDTKVGFSIQHNYPSDIRYKPAKTRSGIDDNIAVIWVVYESQNESNSPDLIPIRLRITTMSEYRARHWDYDFSDTEACPTEESVIESRKSPQPLELNWTDGCFFSPSRQALLDEKGNTVSGQAILDKLFRYHCDTVHPIKGLPFRSRHHAEIYTRRFIDKIADVLLWVLRHIFGRTLDERQDRISYLDGYAWKDFKKISLDTIELAGYRTSKRVILLFSVILVVAGFLVLPVKEDTYLGNVLKSEFLMVVHSILGLYLLDELIPSGVFWCLNGVIKLRGWYFN